MTDWTQFSQPLLSLKKTDRLALTDRPLELPFQHKITNFGMKPGPPGLLLWYACGNEWVKELSQGSEIGSRAKERIARIRYAYLLDIDLRQMFVLRTTKQTQSFTRQRKIGEEDLVDCYIDWEALQDDYAGIEICPYHYSMRRYCWYSTWDVASGVIWNSIAIRSYELLTLKAPPRY